MVRHRTFGREGRTDGRPGFEKGNIADFASFEPLSRVENQGSKNCEQGDEHEGVRPGRDSEEPEERPRRASKRASPRD
jgi:hypothetical protein